MEQRVVLARYDAVFIAVFLFYLQVLVHGLDSAVNVVRTVLEVWIGRKAEASS